MGGDLGPDKTDNGAGEMSRCITCKYSHTIEPRAVNWFYTSDMAAASVKQKSGTAQKQRRD